MKRRSFIKDTGLIVSAAPFIVPFTKNKKYNLALIGCGWWGMNILREAIAHGACKVVALCDVDESALNKALGEVKQLNGDNPKRYKDFREMIARERPEITIVGTPDHWHALPAIEAISRGSHVYLEKPIGHTIGEGKAILKAARENDRVVQIGTHRRVSPHNISAMEFLKSGKAGRVSQVKAFINYGQGPGESVPDEEPPAGLDWDFWVGPAAMRAYNKQIHPRGFRQYLNFANGTMADWGIHWFDQVLWWSEEKYPKKVFSSGARFVRNDRSDAPDTQMAIYEFEQFTLTWEHKLCAPNAYTDHDVGCFFYGSEGTLHLGWRDGWTFYPKNKKSPIIHEKPVLHEPDDQNIRELWADLIQSIETGKRPVCDIQIGHRSTNISLLGMLSYKLGRSVQWDGEKELCVDDAEANKLLTREYRGEWKYPV